ncbi:MAG: NUDIX domain-containing protein [Clostridiales bacterium]|nr:NUDIX domain-containing protein [Clostridiales bacterium]
MIVVAAGVLRRGDGILLCQRNVGAHQELLWEFPGGKLEEGESPEKALERELLEELNIRTRTGRVLDAVFHRYPGRDVLVLFLESAIVEGEPEPVDCRALSWVSPEALFAKNLAPADAVFAGRFFKSDI